MCSFQLKKLIFGILLLFLAGGIAMAQTSKHSFQFSKTDFLLDGKPFQIISGEMHPARIPAEYWRHRIQMARAMGCNTIAAYIFWNYHEVSEGSYDFSSWNRDIAKFIRIAQEEGMWGINVCRARLAGGAPEVSAISPTGKKFFAVLAKLGNLYID